MRAASVVFLGVTEVRRSWTKICSATFFDIAAMARHRFRVRSCSISKCEPAQLTAFDRFARYSSFARLGDSSRATRQRASCNSLLSAWVVFERVIDRKSVVSGKRVSVRVDLGGRRL